MAISTFVTSCRGSVDFEVRVHVGLDSMQRCVLTLLKMKVLTRAGRHICAVTGGRMNGEVSHADVYVCFVLGCASATSRCHATGSGPRRLVCLHLRVAEFQPFEASSVFERTSTCTLSELMNQCLVRHSITLFGGFGGFGGGAAEAAPPSLRDSRVRSP